MNTRRINELLTEAEENIAEARRLLAAQPEQPPPPVTHHTGRVSDAFDALNLSIVPASTARYRIADVWTTYRGSWDVTDHPYSIPQWARDTYGSSIAGGADHHIMAAVRDASGNLVSNLGLLYVAWPDGLVPITSKVNGVADFPMNASYSPERGESGPYSVFAGEGGSDMLRGVGLPNNEHVSVWVVFQEVAVPRSYFPLSEQEFSAALRGEYRG